VQDETSDRDRLFNDAWAEYERRLRDMGRKGVRRASVTIRRLARAWGESEVTGGVTGPRCRRLKRFVEESNDERSKARRGQG
jgi:hypothetical protein